MRVLITGGAGFVGAHLAVRFREADPATGVVCLDNLRRRGSELSLTRLAAHGVEFRHGDIRQAADLEDLDGTFDLLVEASAEPSVRAGLDGHPAYVVQTNLGGTANCLEFARRRCGAVVFLSTSRVYSIPALLAVALRAGPTRFDLALPSATPGVGPAGFSEAFPTHGHRSLYGTTKLASELLVQEYAHLYRLPALIDRCGVLAGPGQMGRVDQGVFTLWMARHVFGGRLAYTGYGGRGLQVRDLLHPGDLFALLQRQLGSVAAWAGEVYNVGGGMDGAVSLLELTGLCQEINGRSLEIEAVTETTSVDVPYFVSDATRARATFDWSPAVPVRALLREIHDWLVGHAPTLRPLFA